MDERANLIGADRSAHKGFGELLSQVRKSLGCLQNHGGIHLSAADGGTTMPELARWVQVRDVLRRSAPSGLRSGPQVRWSGGPAVPVRDGQVDSHTFPQTRGASNQGHSRTPAKGSRCSTWPTLPFGSAAPVLPSCCTGRGPALAVFRETAGRSRVFRNFHAALRRRDPLNSFRRGKMPATNQGSVPSFACQAPGTQPSVSRRSRELAICTLLLASLAPAWFAALLRVGGR